MGHPLAELPLPTDDARGVCGGEWAGSGEDVDWLAAWEPTREIGDHLPEMLEAARTAEGGCGMYADYEFVVPLAPTLSLASAPRCMQIVKEHGSGVSVRLVDDARATLFHARASVVASGTATVEAALIGNPFVVVYRVSALTYAIAKRVVKVPHVAMANLIAGKRVVPELIQHDFTAANIVEEIGAAATGWGGSRVHDEGAGGDSRGAELAAGDGCGKRIWMESPAP